jgi:hypothetical protein
VEGPAALRSGLPSAARLSRARRIASERGWHPDPATANGRRPRSRHRRDHRGYERRATRRPALLPGQLPGVECVLPAKV